MLLFSSLSSVWGLAAVVLILTLPVSAALAQATSWIQVESQNTLLDTRNRAQFFAEEFPDTHAFQTTSAWNAIALGPMTAAEARLRLQRLKQAGMIPPDSFISDGKSFRTQLWPLKANTQTTPQVTVENQPANGTLLIEDAPATPAVAPSTTAPATTTATTTAITPPPPTTVPAAPTAPPTEKPATKPAPAEQTTALDTEASPPAAEPAQPIPDPDLRATRLLELGWSREQKKQYQTYLTWTGDYESAIDGSYGPGTRKAIRQFQQREGFQPTGFLTETQIALLQSRFEAIQQRLGVQKLSNLDAGVEILYPSKLVTFDRFEPPFVRYKSADGSGVRMMLISQKGGRDMLTGLYDIMSTFDDVPPDGYRKKRRDWFVLSGRNDKVVSYTYARVTNGTIKGFSLIWPPARDNEMQPLVTAMYDSFTPLDNYVLDEKLGYGQSGKQPVDLSKGLEIKTPIRAATGFFINADGALLTSKANVQGCGRITVGDATEMVVKASDANLGLALLVPKAPFSPKSFALFSGEAPALGTEVSVAGFSFPDVMDSATLNYGTVTDTKGPAGDARDIRVSAFLEKGDVGGPVLDDRGAVVGMNLIKPTPDSGLPEYVNFALKSAEITPLLERENLVYGTSRAIDPVAPVDLAAMAGDFTAKVSCWR